MKLKSTWSQSSPRIDTLYQSKALRPLSAWRWGLNSASQFDQRNPVLESECFIKVKHTISSPSIRRGEVNNRSLDSLPLILDFFKACKPSSRKTWCGEGDSVVGEKVGDDLSLDETSLDSIFEICG